MVLHGRCRLFSARLRHAWREIVPPGDQTLPNVSTKWFPTFNISCLNVLVEEQGWRAVADFLTL